MRMLARVGAIFVAAATPVVMMIAAAPAASAATAPVIVIDPNPVVPGGQFSFSGSGCVSAVPGQPAEVLLTVSDGSAVVTAEVDGSGHWALSGRTPANESPGVYKVTAECDTYTSHFAYSPNAIVVYSAAGAPKVTIPAYGSNPAIKAGSSVVVDGTHFRAGEKVSFVLHSTPIVLASFPADSAGAVTGTVTIPADTTIGAHTIELVGQSSALTAAIGIEVTAAAGTVTTTTTTTTTTTPTASPSLASTGVDTPGLLTAGLALAVAGAGALLVGRRRAAGRAS